ncbi:MAG: hypothetical protein ACK4S4_05030 [Pyrinomonadaceae bacterium]
MRANKDRYWFPAKRYGWGWGPPATWQGWVVLLAFIVFVSVWSVVFLPNEHPWLFAFGIAGAVAALNGICLAKGEPPRWRWGDRNDGD